MIDNNEKVIIILNKLDNLEAVMKSFIDNADNLKDKYSLEEELEICNKKKAVFIEMLKDLGYSLG